MKVMSKAAVALVAIAVLMLAACGGTSSATSSTGTTPTATAPAASKYTVALQTLNNSGVTGTVNLTLTGNQLTVNVQATGLVPNKTHLQHIHGAAGKTATCPPASAANAQGIITLAAGVPFYGPIAMPLTPFPTSDASGTENFTQTYTLTSDQLAALTPLTNHVIVVHGLVNAGAYDPSIPVACGAITGA